MNDFENLKIKIHRFFVFFYKNFHKYQFGLKSWNFFIFELNYTRKNKFLEDFLKNLRN